MKNFSFSQVFCLRKQTLIHSLLSLLPNFFRSRLNSISPSFTLYKSRSSPLSRAAFAPSHLDLGSQNFDYPFYAKKDIETFPLEKGRLSQPMGGPLPLLSFVEWCLFPLRGGRVISCLWARRVISCLKRRVECEHMEEALFASLNVLIKEFLSTKSKNQP